MDRTLYNEGKEFIVKANARIQKGDYSGASQFLRKAIILFDKAIKTAESNANTNFVAKYEQDRKQANDLIRSIISKVNMNSFLGDVPLASSKAVKVEENSPVEQSEPDNLPDDEDMREDIEEELTSEASLSFAREQSEPKENIQSEKLDMEESPAIEENGGVGVEAEEQAEAEEEIEEEEDVLEKEQFDEPKHDPFPENNQTELYKPKKYKPVPIYKPQVKISKLGEVYHDIVVQLGRDDSGELVTWKPKEQANQHMVAVGMSGTGKTTAVRTILHQLEEQHVPLIIFDLHDDFSAKKVINFGDITINPLELDGLTPKEKAIEFAYICKRIFKLGDQQENKLRESIIACYRLKGINPLDRETWGLDPPTLADVNDLLEQHRDGKTIDTLLGRVKFFHRVELFMSKTKCPFHEMFKGSTVIKLIEFSDNPDLQTALCEIFLNKLLFTVKKSGQSKLRAYCVIDEAHILDDGKDSFRSPLVKIAREARKYGLGLILASQMPKDFSKSVLHNTATIMSLKFNAREEARVVASHMYGLADTDILNLGEIGEAYIKLGAEVHRVNVFQMKDLA